MSDITISRPEVVTGHMRIFMKGDHSITPCVSIVVASIF